MNYPRDKSKNKKKISTNSTEALEAKCNIIS